VSFRHIRGHEHLVQQFAQAAARHRLAHAYLFVGPEGVGKRTFALALAKTLLCENRAPASATGAKPEAFAACQTCPACRWFDAGTHPDFRYLGLPAEKHEFPLELIHEVIRILSVKPARSQYRLVVLDDADTLNEESANAFLKTLEEPPAAFHSDFARHQSGLSTPNHSFTLPDCLFSSVARAGRGGLPAGARVGEIATGSLTDCPTVSGQSDASPSAGQSRSLVIPAKIVGKPQRREQRRRACGRADADLRGVGRERFASQRQRAHLAVGFLVELYRLALRLHTDKQIGQQLSEQDKKFAAAVVDRLSVPELLRRLDRCMMADYQIDRRLHLALVLEALADSLVS
jgi:DNA polymerase-3 subunit delta'